MGEKNHTEINGSLMRTRGKREKESFLTYFSTENSKKNKNMI